MDNITLTTGCPPRQDYRNCKSVYSIKQQNDDLNFEDIQYAREHLMQEYVQLTIHNPRSGPTANNIRSEFANYFFQR